MKIVCMIPARAGSQRLKKKNFLKINNKSLVERAVHKAVISSVFDDVYINSANEALLNEGANAGAKVFKRSEELSNNTATSEDFIHDFLLRTDCDYVVQLHSIAPLITINEIKQFVEVIKKEAPDTILSFEKIILEVFKGQTAINFDISSKTNSQDLQPLQMVSWGISAWKRETFLDAKANNNCGTYAGNVMFFELEKLSNLVIKTAQDFKLIKYIAEHED
jgi:CMP-N-acetylneuraminic acid synthetase